MLLGSSAQDIVHHADVPVCIVRLPRSSGPREQGGSQGPIRRRDRLGGLLREHERDAA
jgi:hypothetical protein